MEKTQTSINFIMKFHENNIYIKREDLNYLPFGGNKVRKLELFLADAKNKNANYIVTYGAAQSNHCRLTVSMAKKFGFNVLLILANTDEINYNGNFLIYDLYDTEIIWTETNEVPEIIEKTLQRLRDNGNKPYFIQGGGHGDLGTHAYKLVFDEILMQEKYFNVKFDHIFHASGTGTTQAGLIAGNVVNRCDKDIIGISVARNAKRGSEVVRESIQSYLENYYSSYAGTPYKLQFLDEYVGAGYADIYPEIIETIKDVIKNTGIILDPVYTGKAFYGMIETILQQNIKNKSILFIHTGGTPLLFNYAEKFKAR